MYNYNKQLTVNYDSVRCLVISTVTLYASELELLV